LFYFNPFYYTKAHKYKHLDYDTKLRYNKENVCVVIKF